MTVYNMYIFNKDGDCIFYREWNRKKHTRMSKEEEFKLMYGMLFSIKSFIVPRMSPEGPKDGFIGYKTSSYHLHFLETPSSLKIVMNTDPNNTSAVRKHLEVIYGTIFVQYVAKNPLIKVHETIDSELFANKLDEYVRSLPYFS